MKQIVSFKEKNKTPLPTTKIPFSHWFIVNADGQTLGKLASNVSQLLRGKEFSNFSPAIDQGNYVIVINSEKIKITGKKKIQKNYHRNSQRPGSLKTENFQELQDRIPNRILENSIWGMLPKGVLGRIYYRRLFIFKGNKLNSHILSKVLFENSTFQNIWKVNF